MKLTKDEKRLELVQSDAEFLEKIKKVGLSVSNGIVYSSPGMGSVSFLTGFYIRDEVCKLDVLYKNQGILDLMCKREEEGEARDLIIEGLEKKIKKYDHPYSMGPVHADFGEPIFGPIAVADSSSFDRSSFLSFLTGAGVATLVTSLICLLVF